MKSDRRLETINRNSATYLPKKQAYITRDCLYDVYVKRLILPPTDHHIKITIGLAKFNVLH